MECRRRGSGVKKKISLVQSQEGKQFLGKMFKRNSLGNEITELGEKKRINFVRKGRTIRKRREELGKRQKAIL